MKKDVMDAAREAHEALMNRDDFDASIIVDQSSPTNRDDFNEIRQN
jgi:hypothetical protein